MRIESVVDTFFFLDASFMACSLACLVKVLFLVRSIDGDRLLCELGGFRHVEIPLRFILFFLRRLKIYEPWRDTAKSC